MTSLEIHASRRRSLRARLGPGRWLLASGAPRSRNYRAWTYPFRANSHFLYLTGLQLPGCFLLLDDHGDQLFVPRPEEDHALWHGATPELDELHAQSGGALVRYLDEVELAALARGAGTIPPQEEVTASALASLLGRPVKAHGGASLVEGSPDARLADALVAQRLVHDDAALAQIRAAAEVTALAHQLGRAATRAGAPAHRVHAAMEQVVLEHGAVMAYSPIVTPHGEVLHSDRYDLLLHEGDLLLADVGAESSGGWASDVTRTWPVSGKLSASQRDLYELVLRAQTTAISLVRPGVEYRSIHHAARRQIVAGLVELGILHGDVDELDSLGAGDIFFPHGIGHLLGLDVHDMEDLGDRAGYAPGRQRVSRFGERYLRLDRPLQPGMVVTIEPGFYQVPAILENQAQKLPAGALDRAALARFSDVRGIRIEDDVLVTSAGHEVLTAAIPIKSLSRGGA